MGIFCNMKTTVAQSVIQLVKSNKVHGVCARITTLNTVHKRRRYFNGGLEESSHPLTNPAVAGVVGRVNGQIADASLGRLFAVVHFAGHQFKITNEDLLLIKTNPYFPNVGEKIVLEKVLVAGSEDFTLIGRPLLDNVRVEATIIEKTLGHEQVQFMYKRRKNVRKMKIFQELQTILRINSITLNSIDESEVD